MIDVFKEILSATKSLKFLELVKVVATENSTELDSMSMDKTVVLNSKFLNPVPELSGTFGLHDLGMLHNILNIPEYKDNAIITVTRANHNGEDIPVGLSFQNASGDFKNEYRFMSREIIEINLPSRTRNAIAWDVAVVPTLSAIQRFQFLTPTAKSSDNTFKARIENGNLIFSVGDKSTHTGEFVFASGVSGTVKKEFNWPLSHVQAILNLPGEKTLDISNRGGMKITVTTGLAVHNYTVLASQ